MTTNREQLATVIIKLQQCRDELLQEVAGISSSDACRGAQWSIIDAVRHLAPPTGGYHRFIKRMVEEESPAFPTFPSPDELWKRQVDEAKKVVDDTIQYAQQLSEEQLNRTALRRGQPTTVVQMLDVMADHIFEHVKQIREEIKPRLGLA